MRPNPFATVLILAAGLASPALHAQPLEPASRTDTRVERDAAPRNAAPRAYDFQGEFATMRDELEGYPVGVSLGGTGHFAPPTATTVPDGFDWGLNNLRGQSSVNFARVVDLSGSPVGGNATRAIQIVTGTAQTPGGFFTGASLRWDTPLSPTADHNARVSAEMYISTIAQQFTFEPVAGFVNFITGRLLWGGVCSDPSPWNCNDLGVPVGPITTIFVLARGPSDFLPIFYPAAYCVGIGSGIIPGCVAPPGSSVGDPVSPPIGAWARWIAEISPDARVSFYLDRFDGEGEFLITRHEIITSSFIDRVQWNSAFESQDAFMLVDNIEASGPLYAPLKPPPLDCPYLDDLEWLEDGLLAGQSDRWDALLDTEQQVIVKMSTLDDARVLSQQNSPRNNRYTRQFSTEVPEAHATLTNDIVVSVDVAMRFRLTGRGIALLDDSNTVARVMLGLRASGDTSFTPEFFVQTNPDYDPIDPPAPADPLANNPIIGVDVAPTGASLWLASRYTVEIRVSANGALRISRNGQRLYAGPAAFGAGFNRLAFESENTSGTSSGYFEVGAIAMSCDASSCATDFDFDDLTSFADLNAVLANFGATGLTGFTPGDANADGTVNFEDLNAVLAAFGTSCK